MTSHSPHTSGDVDSSGVHSEAPALEETSARRDTAASTETRKVEAPEGHQVPQQTQRRDALARWDVWWFRPEIPDTVRLIRICLGVVVLCWALSLGPDLRAFFSSSGLAPDPGFASYRLSPMRWFPSDTAMYVMFGLLILSSLLVTAGWWVRVTAPVMWFLVLGFELDNVALLNSGDTLLRVLTALFALYAALTPESVVGGNAPWPRRSAVSGGAALQSSRPETQVWLATPWLRRLFGIQLSVIYLSGVIAKFAGETWLDGTAALWAVRNVPLERFAMPGVLADSLWFGNVATFATLTLEVAIPILIWFPRWRRPLMVLGISMHLFFGLFLMVGFFSWVMAICYLGHLQPGEAHAFFAWVRRVLGSRRSGRGASADATAA
ncbi:MAG: HTTM domain-containing protein [Actinobacteria bacterium]|nr:HTTM domain-containing protein [Actinomycetota bacterium]